MPAERLTMRKIREVLRLRYDFKLSYDQIAKSCHMGRSTVGDYIQRFDRSPLSWPLDESIDDDQLEQQLFVKPPVDCSFSRPSVDWAYIHKELRRKAVTLMLLWQEYKERHPDGYQYSQFCNLYRQWAARIDPPMRQEHRAGEKTFVDYAGMTVPVFDVASNKWREAQIFVATLGASNYTYAEATWSQTLADWIGAHCHAFAYFGGVTEVVVPDNTKTGVKNPCFYEPDINRTYLEMARHYGTVIIPARVRKPKDKAKVETAVQIVERWILARLRNQSFFSLGELNEAIGRLLEVLNTKPFQKLEGSRKSLFESLERPALKPLPQHPYQFAEWMTAAVNIDYHIEVDGHYYSVPYTLFKKRIDVRITANSIECFYRNKPVAGHIRNYRKGRHTTVKEHMPPSHRKWAEWSPERFVRWAEKIGPHTRALIDKVLRSRPHPQQGFRTALGILRLEKSYGEKRLESACQRAMLIGAVSYRSVASILKHSLDQTPPLQRSDEPSAIVHANIRGRRYYH